MKLAEFIKQYVAFRKGRGEKFTTNEGVLRRFSRTAGKDLDLGNVTADLVKRFLDGSGPLTRYWHRKYSVLRGLFRHAVAHGHLSAWPLPATVPKEPPDFVAYIYSEEELRRMLHGISSVVYQKRKMLLEPHTFRAILLLLYGTGLRIGEAISLRLADVDLKNALIEVRETKFYKSRFVPLGAELNGAMLSYARKRRKCGHPQRDEDFFFVTKTGGRVKFCLIRGAFRRLRSRCGIRRTDAASYQPRLHDLRHTFAVQRLITWYREGKDVQRLLPLLSTYLGHVEIESTQVYLTMTPELLQEAGLRFAKYAFAEVGHE